MLRFTLVGLYTDCGIACHWQGGDGGDRPNDWDCCWRGDGLALLPGSLLHDPEPLPLAVRSALRHGLHLWVELGGLWLVSESSLLSSPSI